MDSLERIVDPALYEIYAQKVWMDRLSKITDHQGGNLQKDQEFESMPEPRRKEKSSRRISGWPHTSTSLLPIPNQSIDFMALSKLMEPHYSQLFIFLK